ncbi:uncharacterized protein N7515_000522 [Penicillium bovifimosum]|uniref:U6 small nuclear RNA (adenine-(43)-N(6))-methyltransferase n=1 Tax=Penicillium bovifimosum TaxID=126998 RepID=A0A9W9LBM7_9EURO|nr:uncharacterized protein N7515_000522 [Penicillium bovifimosum]KAJ5145958.1 hypothetical protein N7515_000522 [Penicillium bovifimosum]
MEPARSLYKNEVDFAALALQSRDFAKHLKPNGQLDFNDPAAIRQLTTTLLEQDFGLKVEIPDDRLCPPYRLNYILWLQDLIDSTAGGLHEGYDKGREVVGLDMYVKKQSLVHLAVIGYSNRVAVEQDASAYIPCWVARLGNSGNVDENNIRTAQHNVALNNLDSRIQLVKSAPAGPLFPLDQIGQETLDFTMCNPPFYTSRDELVRSAEEKKRVPFSACTGAEVEMVTDGGEVAFVKRMVDESLQSRTRIQWYTSMFGKLSSVSVILEKLIKHDNHNFAVTEFDQGGKTKRWAVAWSWGDRRPAMSVARGNPGCPKHLLPFPSEYSFTLPPGTSIDTATAMIKSELGSLSWFWAWDQAHSSGTGFAAENVWSRHARRKMKAIGQEGMAVLEIPTDVAMGVRVQVRLVRGEKAEDKVVKVLVRWIQGIDTVLFESFCGMVKRKLESK